MEEVSNGYWIIYGIATCALVFWYVKYRISDRRHTQALARHQSELSLWTEEAQSAMNRYEDSVVETQLAIGTLAAVREALGGNVPDARLAMEVRGYVSGADAEASRGDELAEEVRSLRENATPNAEALARYAGENQGLRQRNTRFQEEIRRLNGILNERNRVTASLEGQTYRFDLGSDQANNLLRNISSALLDEVATSAPVDDGAHELNRLLAEVLRAEGPVADPPDRMTLLLGVEEDEDGQELGTSSD